VAIVAILFVVFALSVFLLVLVNVSTLALPSCTSLILVSSSTQRILHFGSTKHSAETVTVRREYE